MTFWEMTTVHAVKPDLDTLLALGWEPFGSLGDNLILLRRPVDRAEDARVVAER